MTGPVDESSTSEVDRPALVGRERECGILRGCLDEALGGRGSLVLLSGEAGIGKTTLLEDLAAHAQAAGCLVLWGHCYDLSVTPPYGPWIGVARRYQASGNEPPFPAFFDDLEALATLGSQARMFADGTAFFTSVADRRPLVILLDDLHWADQVSLEWLRYLAREIRTHSFLVVATYRSDELTRQHRLYQVIPLLVREAGATRLLLGPLDQDAQRGLIAARYRLPDGDAQRLTAYLTAHAEGNPLYVWELLGGLEDDRVLVETAGIWRLGNLDAVRVPSLLMQVIEGRLARLNDETRGLLQMAAVIGHEVPLELWQQASGAEDAAIGAAVEAGLETHLLVEGRGGRVRFRHALMREALYQGTVLVRRRAWHRRVGESLAAAHNSDPDRVAHHFEEAGDPRAIEWLYRAARRAAQSYAMRESEARLEAVLRLQHAHGIEVIPPQMLLFRLSELLRFTDARRALKYLNGSLALAQRSGDRAFAAVTLAQRGYLRWFLGEMRDGVADLDRAVADLDRLLEEDPAAFADTSTQSSWNSLERVVTSRRDARILFKAALGQPNDALGLGKPLVDDVFGRMEAGEISDTTQFVEVSGTGARYSSNLAYGLGIACALRGQVADAHRFFAHAERLFAAQTGQMAVVSYVAGDELRLLHLPYETDRLAERRRLAARMQAAWIGAGEDVPSALNGRAICLPVLFIEGEWREATILAHAYPRGHGILWQRQDAVAIMAGIAFEQGDRAQASTCVAEVLPDGAATTPGNCNFVAALFVQRLAAEMALDEGNLLTARAWLEANDRWLEWSGAVLGRAEGALVWARYYRTEGNRLLARQWAEQALAYAADPRQPLALIAVERLLGALETEDRRFADAEAHLREALTLAGACASPFERALTLLEFAGLRGAQRRLDEARMHLAEVRATCEPLGATPTLVHVAELEERLARAQLRKRSNYPAGLTAREVDVLRLIAEGLSDIDVAHRLFLSPRTVHTHLTAIYGKLGVNSRAAATRFAVEHGLT